MPTSATLQTSLTREGFDGYSCVSLPFEVGIEVGDEVGDGEGDGDEVGVGEGVGVGDGSFTTTPLFQTNFLPDLMQVNFLP